MSVAKCLLETKVSAAARSGEWEPYLAAHAARCAVCREVLEAANWMQALTREASQDCPLPDASLLWQKARWAEMLSEKQAELEKTRKTMQWAELGLLAIAAAGLAFWRIPQAPALESIQNRFVAGLSPQIWMRAYSAAGTGPAALWAAAGAAGVAAIFLALQMLVEE